uniref:Uncharacterized protein n=1 Tax=Anopheles darlingi TaxID=43151 RepID=A0A2M4DQ98_ANODA
MLLVAVAKAVLVILVILLLIGNVLFVRDDLIGQFVRLTIWRGRLTCLLMGNNYFYSIVEHIFIIGFFNYFLLHRNVPRRRCSGLFSSGRCIGN